MNDSAPYNARLFLDDTHIEDTAFVTRIWHQPRKFPEPVLRAEHPWERWCAAIFGSVLHWRGKFHMWYGTWALDSRRCVCYAYSDNGVEWVKPWLGLYEFNGSKENNIVLMSEGEDTYIDDSAVIDDPEDAEWPLKLLSWDGHYHSGGPSPTTGIYAARSKDGIHWDRSLGNVLPEWGDRFNAVSTKVNGKYVVLGRIPGTLTHGAKAGAFDKGRAVWWTDSDNLVDWSEPRLILAADAEDPAYMQFYSGTAFPYEGILLGSIERMYMSPDRLNPEIVWSHDQGHTWQRARTRPAFIPWGAEGSFDNIWINLPASGPIEYEKRLWFYYSGRSSAHGTRYPHNYGSIGLATLRIDGFASLRAEENYGYVLTKPMQWPQAELHVNSDPRRNLESHGGFWGGDLRVEVRDADNRPISGYSWDDCISVDGNTTNLPHAAAQVFWKNKSLRELAGKQLRFAFRLRDCHLYSFRAVPVKRTVSTSAKIAQVAKARQIRPNIRRPTTGS